MAFRLSPDHAPGFHHAAFRAAREHTRQLLAGDSATTLLIGEPGVGKSTLLYTLADMFLRESDAVVIMAGAQVCAKDFGLSLAAACGLQIEGRATAELQSAVETHLRGAAPDRPAFLLIDDADMFDHSVLRMLRTNLRSESRSLRPNVKVLLAGSPRLEARIAESGPPLVAGSPPPRVFLGVMGANEMAAYINHRLALAGIDEGVSFAGDAVSAIFRHSQGIPRTVNLIAGRLLLNGLGARKLAIGEADVLEVVGELRIEGLVDTAVTTPPVPRRDRFANKCTAPNPTISGAPEPAAPARAHPGFALTASRSQNLGTAIAHAPVVEQGEFAHRPDPCRQNRVFRTRGEGQRRSLVARTQGVLGTTSPIRRVGAGIVAASALFVLGSVPTGDSPPPQTHTHTNEVARMAGAEVPGVGQRREAPNEVASTSGVRAQGPSSALNPLTGFGDRLRRSAKTTAALLIAIPADGEPAAAAMPPDSTEETRRYSTISDLNPLSGFGSLVGSPTGKNPASVEAAEFPGHEIVVTGPAEREFGPRRYTTLSALNPSTGFSAPVPAVREAVAVGVGPVAVPVALDSMEKPPRYTSISRLDPLTGFGPPLKGISLKGNGVGVGLRPDGPISGLNPTTGFGDSLPVSAAGVAVQEAHTTAPASDIAGREEPARAMQTAVPPESHGFRPIRSEAADVDRLLAAGDEALRDLRLTTPRGVSAHDSFQAVLEIDPSNERALDGQRQIVAAYLRLSRGAMSRRDFGRALGLLDRAEIVIPEATETQALREKILAGDGAAERRLAVLPFKTSAPCRWPVASHILQATQASIDRHLGARLIEVDASAGGYGAGEDSVWTNRAGRAIPRPEAIYSIGRNVDADWVLLSWIDCPASDVVYEPWRTFVLYLADVRGERMFVHEGELRNIAPTTEGALAALANPLGG